MVTILDTQVSAASIEFMLRTLDLTYDPGRLQLTRERLATIETATAEPIAPTDLYHSLFTEDYAALERDHQALVLLETKDVVVITPAFVGDNTATQSSQTDPLPLNIIMTAIQNTNLPQSGKRILIPLCMRLTALMGTASLNEHWILIEPIYSKTGEVITVKCLDAQSKNAMLASVSTAYYSISKFLSAYGVFPHALTANQPWKTLREYYLEPFLRGIVGDEAPIQVTHLGTQDDKTASALHVFSMIQTLIYAPQADNALLKHNTHFSKSGQTKIIDEVRKEQKLVNQARHKAQQGRDRDGFTVRANPHASQAEEGPAASLPPPILGPQAQRCYTAALVLGLKSKPLSAHAPRALLNQMDGVANVKPRHLPRQDR